jgi:hypothetical protein
MPIDTTASSATSYPPASHQSAHQRDALQINPLSRTDSKTPSQSVALSQRHVRAVEPLKPADQDDGEQTSTLSSGTERKYLAALFWVMIVCGWNDASRYVFFAMLLVRMRPDVIVSISYSS